MMPAPCEGAAGMRAAKLESAVRQNQSVQGYGAIRVGPGRDELLEKASLGVCRCHELQSKGQHPGLVYGARRDEPAGENGKVVEHGFPCF